MTHSKWYYPKHLTGLPAKKSHDLEAECLASLQVHAKCTCGMNVHHFPIIVESKDKTEIPSLTTTRCGKSLDSLSQKELKAISVKSFNRQLKCITNSLSLARVRHLDMPKTGQNLCIKDSIIYLIDFDVACLRSRPMGGTIAYLLELFGRTREEYTKTFTEKCARCLIRE